MHMFHWKKKPNHLNYTRFILQIYGKQGTLSTFYRNKKCKSGLINISISSNMFFFIESGSLIWDWKIAAMYIHVVRHEFFKVGYILKTWTLLDILWYSICHKLLAFYFLRYIYNCFYYISTYTLCLNI